ncbi:MAG TPA: CoA-transferase [Candidatus Limnocylindria bacterium]|nr:CoA-transferase [Candidatus Limnocylindria bacterium]
MTTTIESFTTSELMVVAGARELRDGELAFVGLGIPQLAAALAQRTHAPRLVVLNEIGLADPHPVAFGVGNADPRHWYGASFMGSFNDVMGKLLHRGLVDVGFLGALEVDAHGNANATQVPRVTGGIRRFGGGGGANDIASLARSTILIVRHERRKLVERLTHLTNPGFLDGPGARERGGLRGGGPRRVLTDKCVFGVDESTARLVVHSIHPGVTADDLREATGFALDVPKHVATTEPPSAEEIRLIREVIDPERRYTKSL